MREGHNFVALVDLLVDNVPDIDVGIDVAHERVSEQVVQQGFSRHEFVGIDKDNNDGLLTLQQLLQLRCCLQIFHYYNYVQTNTMPLKRR